MTETNETRSEPAVELNQALPDSSPASGPAPVKKERSDPGPFRRILRIVLFGLVAVAVVFLAGLLTDHFTRYQPLKQSLTQTQTDLAQAEQALSDAQAGLAASNQKAATLQSDSQALQSELDTAKAQLQLLRVLVDIKNARLALYQQDVTAAKAALASTPQRLEDLLPSITRYDANLAESMPQRLNLIIYGLDRNVETAAVDLELFTKDLQEIEVVMFGG